MSVLIAAVVWVGAIGLLIFRGRAAADRSTIYALLGVGVGLTLNISPIYLVVDGWLGGHNLGYLLGNAVIVVGVFFLARGVAKAADWSSFVTRVVLGRVAPWIAVAVAVVAFFEIDTDGSTNQFMVDHGDQPAAATFSVVEYFYFGLVTLAMAIVCIHQLRRARGFMLVATITLLVGSVIQTVTSVDVIFMDIVHLVDNEPLLSLGQAFYNLGNSLGFVLMTAGCVMLPSARFFGTRRTKTQISRLIRELTPAWGRALRLMPSGPAVEASGDQESVLYRHLVEIRDAQASLGPEYKLSPEEATALERAENLLLGSPTVPARHEA